MKNYTVYFYYKTDCRAIEYADGMNMVIALAIVLNRKKEYFEWVNDENFYIKIEMTQ
jgi:hypothetical protein